VLGIISMIVAGLSAVVLERGAQRLHATPTQEPYSLYTAASFVGLFGVAIGLIAIVYGAQVWRRMRHDDMGSAPFATWAIAVGLIGAVFSGTIGLISLLLNLVFKGAEF
jgi:hypothetical protein